MALYIGDRKVKIHFGNTAMRLHINTTKPIFGTVLLRASDGYILKDSAGLRLKAKETTNNG